MFSITSNHRIFILAFCSADIRCKSLVILTISDHSKGFGGKYGVQKDRQDQAAVGWDHHEKVEKHASQKGRSLALIG